MSSFDDYYKKWKKEKGINTDIPYKNLTNEQKAQEASKDVNEMFEKYKNNNNANTQRNITVWEQVNTIANNNFNNSRNTSLMLRNDNEKKGREAILNAKNRNTINDSVLQSKNNTIWNNITNNANKNMLFSKANQTLPVQLNEENMIENLSNIDRKERYKQTETVTPNEKEKASLNLKIEEYLQSKRSQEEAERINKDIEEGNYLSSVGHVLKGVPEEALNATMKTVGAINDILPNNLKQGRDKDTDYAKVTKAITKGYTETTSQINNNVVKTASSVSGSIGNMVPSILMDLAMPGSGRVVSALNVGGDSYLDTIDEDKGNKAQSILTALGKGGVTYGIEGLTGGNFLAKGSLDDIAKRTISNKLSSDLSKKVASKIYEFGGETLEENLENQLGYVIDKAINNKNISVEEWKNDFTETSKNTILTTAILNLLHLGGNTYNEIKQNEKLDNKSKDVLQEMEKIINNEKISINNKEQQRNLQQETTNKQVNSQIQQITQEQKQMLQNGNTQQMQSNYNETAKIYSIDTNNDTVKGLYEVANKRGINIYYDSDAFANSNQNAKWTVDNKGNRTVVLNPNANTNSALQSVMIHELTHDIESSNEYNKINEMVLNKLKQADNYNDMMLDIANIYKNEYSNMSKEDFSKMIEQEAVADYLGENLGNQEFVNELVKSQDRNTIQKIMNWVKNKITSLKNTVTGNQEANYWNKIRENFEKAYNQEYQGNNNKNRLSIAGQKGMKNAIKQDAKNIQLEKMFNKAQQMHKANIDNETIRKQTSWFQDRNGDWKFEFSDKDMALKNNVEIKENRTYRLEDILEHDVLFQLYPELKDYKVQIKDTNKIAGNYNKNSKSIILSSNAIKNNKKAEGTLVHEIQHAIQDIEGYELGTTSKLSKKSYYESLGEIEADNTRTRLIDEKYNNKNINNIAPESSKENPKHRNYDNYMNNRSILDKAKDSMFKYFKRLGDSDEANQGNIQENMQQNSRLVDDGGNGRYIESENNSGSFNLPENHKQIKQQQLEIINNANPMQDDYHTGIRDIEDIKTLQETLQDSDWADYDEFNPDLTRNMIESAIETGKITVYSSYPIENGVFISPSYMEAESYSSNGKVHSKEVNINDVAWIDPTQGQYAKISNNKYSKQSKGIWQQYLKDTSVNNGTKETIQDVKIPISRKTQEEVNSPTRHETIQKYRNLARENIENISTWKDKSNGLKYQLETMERNMYDIIPDKTEAQRVNDTYFEPIHKAEAEKQKFINSYNKRIQEYKLNKYESEAVQYLGEQKYNPSHEVDQVITDRINENIEKGKIDKDKVNNAIETFREIYDELFELENSTLKEYGYQEKPYRKGYFPHFIDYIPETKTEKVLDKLGFKIDKRPLPTNIAGITEQFVPGKTWNKSALERKGNKTDYNALKGFDTYIQQASDNIFHTEDIQKLRGLENEIRYQYSDKGVKERIDNILNDETLFQEEKQDLIDKIFEQVENPVSNLVTELRRYTNALANKKSEADRSIENKIGRPIYSTVNAIENRFGANAVGLNIGSAVTNFIPITQAYSQVSTRNMGRAFIDTVKSYIRDDGFVDKSTFLTNRLNQSEKLYKTSLEKISDKTSFLFDAIDEVTSNIVTRGKYLENISKGMNEAEAIKNADRFAANVISDRSKGSLPTLFEEKNPLTKMFTQFQLEVNNQYRYMFKDIPRDLKEKGTAYIALALFKMFVGAFLYNKVSEEVTGRKSAFSPIDMAISSYDTITDKDQTTANKIINISSEVGEQVPFVGGLFGGGRVPVNGAIPNSENLLKSGIGLATGEMDKNKAIDTIGKEVSKPLYYLLPPFGGGQAKKTVEGIKTVKKGGSYGIDNKGEKTLQFPVENAKVSDYIKAGIFGKYSLPLAKEYTNNKYKSLNAKDTKGYETTKIPYKEFLTYTNSKLTKKEDKINFINSMNINGQQKWDMYCYDIFENETRKKDGGSQLEDAKYAVSNGTTKKEYIDLYNKYKEKEMDMPTKEENKELIKNGIKLKNYMDYSIKVHDETKKQKKDGKIKQNSQLKNKDKIDILLKSNYSEAEKKAIYSNYLNKEDKKIILVDKMDFPLEQYLKYKQQEFKNDKDEDEESVSGSKKKKIYNYLNDIDDMDLSQDYKKIICKIENINSYDKDITKFVLNNRSLTHSEQKDILEVIGFDVAKYGNIKTTTMLPIKKNVK